MNYKNIIGVIIVTLCLSSSGFAQSPALSAADKTKTVKQASPYITSLEVMKTYFISGTVPASYPTYDPKTSHEEYGQLVQLWLGNKQNYMLLSKLGKQKASEVQSKINRSGYM